MNTKIHLIDIHIKYFILTSSKLNYIPDNIYKYISFEILEICMILKLN